MGHDFKTGGKDYIECKCGAIFKDGDIDKDPLDNAKNKFLNHLDEHGLFELAFRYDEEIVK